jgi:ABC-type transport system involved in cytochrome c biogenesis permease component
MVYFRCLTAGVVAASFAAILWVLAVFVLPIFVPMLISRVTGSDGAARATVDTGSILLAAFAGFAAGCRWQFRRDSRAPHRSG